MNTLYTQFKQALKREKQSITTYYNNVTYPCLYRKVNDKEDKEYLTIYYEKDIPIQQGQLLSHGGKHFITLNKESVENDTYYKSSLLQCNLILPVVVNQVKNNIPCYAYNMTSPMIISNDIINTLDGKCEVITENTTTTNNILLESIYNVMGGYFKVQNKHDISGISHIFIERTAKPPENYGFDMITDATEYIEGTTTIVSTQATINDVIDDTASIEFTSSDTLIAIVDTKGIITFIKSGSVVITARWVQKNLSDTVNLTVKADVPVLKNTFTLKCSNTANQIYIGSNRTFTASLRDGSGVGVPFTPVWSYNWNGMLSSKFTITTIATTIVGDNKIKIAVVDDVALLGKTGTVTCTTSDGLYSQSVVVTIMSGM